MKIIALSGYKGSGKDTVADYLVKEHGYIRFGFADILKDMVANQYDIDRTWLDNPEFKERPLLQYPVNPKDSFSDHLSSFMVGEFRDEKGDSVTSKDCLSQLYWTPRALAILEGSVKRTVNSNYWVDAVVAKIFNINSDCVKHNKFVISDLRYKNEIARLKRAFDNKLTTVEIKRFTTVNSTDPSERDLDGVTRDITLFNTSNIDDLYLEIENRIIKS